MKIDLDIELIVKLSRVELHVDNRMSKFSSVGCYNADELECLEVELTNMVTKLYNHRRFLSQKSDV